MSSVVWVVLFLSPLPLCIHNRSIKINQKRESDSATAFCLRNSSAANFWMVFRLLLFLKYQEKYKKEIKEFVFNKKVFKTFSFVYLNNYVAFFQF